MDWVPGGIKFLPYWAAVRPAVWRGDWGKLLSLARLKSLYLSISASLSILANRSISPIRKQMQQVNKSEAPSPMTSISVRYAVIMSFTCIYLHTCTKLIKGMLIRVVIIFGGPLKLFVTYVPFFEFTACLTNLNYVSEYGCIFKCFNPTDPLTGPVIINPCTAWLCLETVNFSFNFVDHNYKDLLIVVFHW